MKMFHPELVEIRAGGDISDSICSSSSVYMGFTLWVHVDVTVNGVCVIERELR